MRVAADMRATVESSSEDVVRLDRRAAEAGTP
jgi:hypothetical protein